MASFPIILNSSKTVSGWRSFGTKAVGRCCIAENGSIIYTAQANANFRTLIHLFAIH